jgi:hypothetical protein
MSFGLDVRAGISVEIAKSMWVKLSLAAAVRVAAASRESKEKKVTSFAVSVAIAMLSFIILKIWDIATPVRPIRPPAPPNALITTGACDVFASKSCKREAIRTGKESPGCALVKSIASRNIVSVIPRGAPALNCGSNWL